MSLRKKNSFRGRFKGTDFLLFKLSYKHISFELKSFYIPSIVKSVFGF